MTHVGIFCEIEPEPSRNPLVSALGISLELRLYFTVYPSSCHSTDTVFLHPGTVYWNLTLPMCVPSATNIDHNTP